MQKMYAFVQSGAITVMLQLGLGWRSKTLLQSICLWTAFVKADGEAGEENVMKRKTLYYKKIKGMAQIY